jgi:carbon-monoxide dehydrogenase medium subunit
MKPAAFEYHAPRSPDEALALLAKFGAEGRVLAGGQSLVPAMNFRLARPAVLVDINRIDAFAGVSMAGGVLTIATLTRHVVFERPIAPGPLARLLPTIAHNIAHLPIRTRGTFGGSLAHADPSAEWCALALALDADIVAQSISGQRVIPARDFFKTIFTTDLREGEMITEIRIPILDDSWRCGFVEFNRRAGDFAIVLAIAAFRVANGKIAEAKIALGGVVDRPVRADDAEKTLVGAAPDQAAFAAAANAARRSFVPLDDIHASSEYKSELVATMTRRALERAVSV